MSAVNTLADRTPSIPSTSGAISYQHASETGKTTVTETNLRPYEPPKSIVARSDRQSAAATWCSRLALALIAFPFVVAFRLYYWAMNLAGAWYVSTDIPPYDRGLFLRAAYLADQVSMSVVCAFAASILLWRDRWNPRITGGLAVCSGVIALPALLFIGARIWFYLTLDR